MGLNIHSLGVIEWWFKKNLLQKKTSRKNLEHSGTVQTFEFVVKIRIHQLNIDGIKAIKRLNYDKCLLVCFFLFNVYLFTIPGPNYSECKRCSNPSLCPIWRLQQRGERVINLPCDSDSLRLRLLVCHHADKETNCTENPTSPVEGRNTGTNLKTLLLDLSVLAFNF